MTSFLRVIAASGMILAPSAVADDSTSSSILGSIGRFVSPAIPVSWVGGSDQCIEQDMGTSSAKMRTHEVFIDHMEKSSNKRNPELMVRDVLRLPNISVEEFEEKYARSDVAVPIVFEGLMDDSWDASQWTREAIYDDCGDVSLIYDDDDCRNNASAWWDEDCHSVKFVNESLRGETWAGLDIANLTTLNLTTLGDLLRAQDEGVGSHLYLHDAPMEHYCPARFHDIRVPKYFPLNYRYLESDPDEVGEMEADHFPDIFISKKGSGSPLHSDADMTRFFVHVLSGKKLWRIFSPSEYWRLDPTDTEDYYPTRFLADAFHPDFDKFPYLDGALVYETVLSAGEVIFIPEGWPHQVYNLEDAIATSMNFVDWHAMENHLKYKAFGDEKAFSKSYFRRTMTSFFMPLDPEERDNPEENIPLPDYLNSHHFYHIEVSYACEEWVESRLEYPNGIDSYRTSDGFPALHVASMANYYDVVEYLLENNADTNVLDYRGRTALEVVKELGFEDIVDLLENYSDT